MGSNELSNMVTKNKLRILLIDDDEIDRQSIVRHLAKSETPCEIFEATSANDGLQKASEVNFDIILLDYHLPDQDGIETLRKLRHADFKKIAVIVISRQDNHAIAEQCLEAGAQDFLLKDEVTSLRLTRALKLAQQRYQIEQDLRNSREQLRDLAEHDPLTGLLNRRGFEMTLLWLFVVSVLGRH